MTHNHERQEWWKEGLISLATGTLYGATNTLTGHPMDTVKCKMQAQSGFLKGHGGGGMIDTIRTVFRREGLMGFYRGVVPPMWGSVVYRSIQFSVFESVYTKLTNTRADNTIPFTGGLQIKTVVAGFCGASSRAFIESPVEYAKVRRQTGHSWQLRNVYDGFLLQYVRTCPLLTLYFVSIDSIRRHTTLMDSFWGQFIASGGSAALGFWVIWPLETLKNQVQAGTEIEGIAKPTIRQRIQYLGGFTGLYRGILPGTISVFSRNGAAMIVMQKAQRMISETGLRDTVAST
ncbi:Mitochondrial substrate carrier family protein G [Diplonema papillatum]|nr:Mitochondrial substrate carrier family protein G [Diplonema papillatum]